jgi:hypothetical protein
VSGAEYRRGTKSEEEEKGAGMKPSATQQEHDEDERRRFEDSKTRSQTAVQLSCHGKQRQQRKHK